MKFAKIYVTLPGVENLPADQVTCNFTDKSFHFTAHNLNGKNHVLKVTSLAYNIRPDASNVKVNALFLKTVLLGIFHELISQLKIRFY